jgi:hypothetical protein
VKKISADVVQLVPSAFSDEEMEDEPRRTGFFSCFCYELSFGVHCSCTPSSENEFVDVGTFSDVVHEYQATPDKPAATASTEAKISKALVANVSPNFTEALECTVDRSGGLLEDPPLIGTHRYPRREGSPSCSRCL